MIDLGKVTPGATLRIPFGSYAAATGASAATSGYAAADVQIYKDGNTTQRASASGITASTDFDALTGINLVSIDLSDNTTAGFYSAGSEYLVVIADVTIDAQTVRFPIARFRIGMAGAALDTTIASLSSQTSFTLSNGSADNSAYAGCDVYVHDAASAVQCCMGTISAYTGSTRTVTLAADPAIFTMATGDNISIYPRRNVDAINGSRTAAGNARNFFTSTGYANSNNGIGSVTGAVGSVAGNVGGNVVGTVGGVGTNGITAASLATDAGAEIAAAVVDQALSGHTTSGTVGEALANTEARGARTVCRGTVGSGTTPSTTQFTASALTPAGAAADQFKGRIIIFDIATSTAALRGQATDITANTSASLPLFTFSTLTTAPSSGDTFSIV